MESKHLDINPESHWLYHTPSEISQGYPFYVTECGFFAGNEGYFTERDWKNSYLMIYTLSGIGALHYKEQDYEVHARQAVLLNCKHKHRYHTQEAPWQFYWIHFNGTATVHYEALLNDTSMSIIDIFDSDEFVPYALKIQAMLRNHDMHTDLKASLYLTHLMTQMLYNKKLPQSQKAFHFQQDLQRTVAYIQLHYDEDLSIDTMSEIAHLSKFHFLRLFKVHMGIAPYDYLIHYRITMSKALLQNSTAPIQSISEQVGYKNVNNYIRNFKKLVGVTPNQYRQSWRI